jgi:hypothetical protein
VEITADLLAAANLPLYNGALFLLEFWVDIPGIDVFHPPFPSFA